MPGPVPVGLPSELLERRPDVIAAERRVAAAFNRVGEANAARLPRLSLTANVATVSSELFVLQNTDNPVWAIAGILAAPILDGGALRTQAEIRTVQQKEASRASRRSAPGRSARPRRRSARSSRPRRARRSSPRDRRERAGAGAGADPLPGRVGGPQGRGAAAARPLRGPFAAPAGRGGAARSARQRPPRTRRQLRAPGGCGRRLSRQERALIPAIQDGAGRTAHSPNSAFPNIDFSFRRQENQPNTASNTTSGGRQ